MVQLLTFIYQLGINKLPGVWARLFQNVNGLPDRETGNEKLKHKLLRFIVIRTGWFIGSLVRTGVPTVPFT
jgi:hypothetical protein